MPDLTQDTASIFEDMVVDVVKLSKLILPEDEERKDANWVLPSLLREWLLLTLYPRHCTDVHKKAHFNDC